MHASVKLHVESKTMTTPEIRAPKATGAMIIRDSVVMSSFR
jgi:hypothetical protein